MDTLLDSLSVKAEGHVLPQVYHGAGAVVEVCRHLHGAAELLQRPRDPGPGGAAGLGGRVLSTQRQLYCNKL